ncbi:MAG: hypothetical protein JOZ83_16715 [Silvibacterium sp.]|nr:hypothetical protein [Silvibacterium sp.]
MKAFLWLALAIVAGTSSCKAQQTFGPLSATPGLRLTSYSNAGLLPSGLHFKTASPTTIVAVPPAIPGPSRTADSRYFLVNGSFLGMAVFDVEMTQHCIADRHCREQNPLMPSSHAGQLGLNLGLVAGVSGASYWLKKHRSSLWWLPSATGIAAHSAGVASGFEHQ